MHRPDSVCISRITGMSPNAGYVSILHAFTGQWPNAITILWTIALDSACVDGMSPIAPACIKWLGSVVFRRVQGYLHMACGRCIECRRAYACMCHTVYVCACLYVWTRVICVRFRPCTCTCTRMCMCMCMWICLCKCMYIKKLEKQYIYIYIYIYICMDVDAYVYMYVCVCVCTCLCFVYVYYGQGVQYVTTCVACMVCVVCV
jgi:hypothetical protein